MMQIVRDYKYAPREARGAVAAIGNFDGVHLGHRKILETSRRVADRLDAPHGVLTFEPHPRTYFSKGDTDFRLMNAGAKAHRLEKLGVDILFQLAFNAVISALPPERFIEDVLVEGLGLTHVVVGEEFRFGYKRAGDIEMLREHGPRQGFGVTQVPLLSDKDKVFSSSAIRSALSEGDPRSATKMLGHFHRIEGEVLHGDARGRQLGFPTANLSLEGVYRPKYGIYAVYVDVLSGPHMGQYEGAASLGERPSFGKNKPNLEVNIFDFSGDLYGAEISVALVEFLRPEIKFDRIEDLIDQMKRDCDDARARLQNRSSDHHP